LTLGDHPFVLFNFGMTYNDMGRHDEAVKWLTRCITVSDLNESHVRKAYALLAGSMMQLGQMDQATARCQRALEIYPDDSELLFRQGMLFHELRQYDQAIAAYRKLLNGSAGRHFASVDRGISGYKARHNLAVTYQDAGRPELAEIQWREALEEAPHRRHAWQSLGNLLIRQQKISEAGVVTDELIGNETLRVEGMILKSRTAEYCGNLDEAQQWLERARTEFPEQEEPLQALCRLFFEHGETSKALQSLSELVKRNPKDPAIHHNLGQVYLQLNAYEDAYQAFRESLRLRPNSEMTRNGLAKAQSALAKTTASSAADR
jgi:tetratricopeptide (TPR) repeat protein